MATYTMNNRIIPPVASHNSTHSVEIVSVPGVGTSAGYRMRGKVGGNFVYWAATSVDSTGAQYTGGGGPPTEIVVFYRIV